MTALNPGDLNDLAQVTLAVLGAGLAPSAVANDPTFRLDVLIAVGVALIRGLPRETYLTEGAGRSTDAFQGELTQALYDLETKQILSVGGPPPDLVLSIEHQPPARATRTPIANFDQHPIVFDRYLVGRCLDEILKRPDLYRFIMDKYADSSEVWQKVYRQYR